MDEHKKLAFIAHMTDRALHHAATTPNLITPKGMSHDKMLSFVSGMAKHGLQHFASGGTTLAGPTNVTSGSDNSAGGVGGGISGFFGTDSSFQAKGVPIQAGTNTNQLNQAYTQTQGALGTQGRITGQLNNGLDQGASNQSRLSQLYYNQATGAGPNPAQAELNQNTGQNIAQTAALIASGRGAGTNAGLTAEQAARSGAATQQQAVGQAATLQAQQQLAAEQNLQNLSANQVAQGTGATQVLNSAQQNEQNILQGANTAANNANVSQQSNINNANAGISSGNASAAGNVVSGILGAGAALAPLALLNKGGIAKPVKYMAGGGLTGQTTSGPQSYVGQYVNSNVDTQGPTQQPLANISTERANPFAFVKDIKPLPKRDGGPNNLQDFDVNNELARNPATGQADLYGSPTGNAIDTTGVMNAYDGGLMKKGGTVRAHGNKERASVPGDSLKNDKVPAMLSEGELVIDRKTMSDPGPMGQMARALAHHLSKKNKK